MADEELPKMFTVEEAAASLKISTRTLRRYMDTQQIEFLSMNALSKRRYARFTSENINAFIRSHSQGLVSENRPKRAYNRRVVKHQRKKRKAA